MGVLPAGTLASAVPDPIQFRLNIDFAGHRKNRPGAKFPRPRAARQKLPQAENFAGLTRQILPVFIKAAGVKASQRLEKNWFTAEQDKVNKYGESVAARFCNLQRAKSAK